MAEAKTDVLYICDPEKNVGCPKRHCKINPNVLHPCESTTQAEFAMLDEAGKPIVDLEAAELMERMSRPLRKEIAEKPHNRFCDVRRKVLEFLNRFRG